MLFLDAARIETATSGHCEVYLTVAAVTFQGVVIFVVHAYDTDNHM